MSDIKQLYKKGYHQSDLDKFVEGLTGEKPNYPKSEPPHKNTGEDYDIMANGITTGGHKVPPPKEKGPDLYSQYGAKIQDLLMLPSGAGDNFPYKYEKRMALLQSATPKIKAMLKGVPPKEAKDLIMQAMRSSALGEKNSAALFDEFAKNWNEPSESSKPKGFWDGYNDGDGADKESPTEQMTEQRNKPITDYGKTPNDKLKIKRLTQTLMDSGADPSEPDFGMYLDRLTKEPTMDGRKIELMMRLARSARQPARD